MNMTTLDKARALLDAMRYLPGPLEAVEHETNRGDDLGAVRAWLIRSVVMDCTIADDLDEHAAEAFVDLHNFAADVALAYVALVERLGELTAIAGLAERRPTAARRARRATQPPPVGAPAGDGTVAAHVVDGPARLSTQARAKLAAAGIDSQAKLEAAVSTDAPPTAVAYAPDGQGVDREGKTITWAPAAVAPEAPRPLGLDTCAAPAIAAALARPTPVILDTPVPGNRDPFEVAGRKLAAVAGVLASVREGLGAILAEATEVDAAGKMVIPPARVGQFLVLQQMRDQLAAALEVHPNPDPREPPMTGQPAQSTA